MTTQYPFLVNTPPPALTWTHLFPASSTYECDGVPESFAGVLPRDLRKEIVRVCWKDASAGLARAAAYAGIVGVNCGNFPETQLRSAGFTYLRRFAVVPNLANARWFVPLDSAAVSAAGLSLYTPSRLSARLKRAAARMAMHARLPIWFKDQIWIAQRALPPLEATLNDFLEGTTDPENAVGSRPKSTTERGIRWALSGGAPEGARNRKASALAIGSGGQMIAFVKLARSAIARRIADNESAVLQELAQTPAVADVVPHVIFSGEVDGTRVLAQSPLPGRPAPVAFTDAHSAFLRSLRSPTIIRAVQAATVSDLADRLLALSPSQSRLLSILHKVLPLLGEFAVPTTIVHGDFAPWNLRSHHGRIGAFDWEYGQTQGLPLMDEIHYRLQSGWLLEDWKPGQACACLKALANRRPLGLTAPQVDAISTIYLLDALARLLGEGYGEDQDVIAWHRQTLEQFARAAAERKESVAA